MDSSSPVRPVRPAAFPYGAQKPDAQAETDRQRQGRFVLQAIYEVEGDDRIVLAIIYSVPI